MTLSWQSRQQCFVSKELIKANVPLSSDEDCDLIIGRSARIYTQAASEDGVITHDGMVSQGNSQEFGEVLNLFFKN